MRRYQKDPERRLIKKVLFWVWKRWAEENAEREMMDNAGKKRKDGARDEIETTEVSGGKRQCPQMHVGNRRHLHSPK